MEIEQRDKPNEPRRSVLTVDENGHNADVSRWTPFQIDPEISAAISVAILERLAQAMRRAIR